ncbi:UNVERIFIED_CONTAM: hypothetical protein FKN15_006886 [Acipenser sinensis]
MLSRTDQQASLPANTQTNKDPTPGGEGAWSPVQRPGENEGSRAHMGLSDDAKLATGSLSQATPAEGAGEKPEREMEMEDGQEVNEMPEEAAQVFSPSVQIVTPPCSLRKRKEAEAYEIEEAHPFLAPQKEPLHGLYEDWPEGADSLPPQKPSGCCGSRCDCCSYSSLKATASLAGALLIAPLLLYGGFVFLPFDAPILSGAPSAVIYTLRCAAFATVPIVLGIAVHGISQLCSSSLDPFGDRKQEVEVHRRFVNQSAVPEGVPPSGSDPDPPSRALADRDNQNWVQPEDRAPSLQPDQDRIPEHRESSMGQKTTPHCCLVWIRPC